MIDLHCHSYYSDGLLSPEALVTNAKKNDVRILALTDHDTVAGLLALQTTNLSPDILIRNGIEWSTQWKKYDIHVIGLGIALDDKNLHQLIQMQKDKRILRAKLIGTILASCGVQDAYQKACELAGHERVGRAHFARVLIQESIVPDIKTAFKRFLGTRQKAYVPSSWMSLKEAVESIVGAGGQAVIAHPLKYKLTRTKLHELVKEFKMLGGVGMEVVSGEMTIAAIEELASICVRFDMLASTGSDYHGDGISRVALGRQRALPASCTPIWQTWGD